MIVLRLGTAVGWKHGIDLCFATFHALIFDRSSLIDLVSYLVEIGDYFYKIDRFVFND